jgi:gamma-glutamylcyclotransferase (GGCT)/AIG2-like uncharacterized protein YtfP
MIERNPFFVDGTLIMGQPNDFYWEDCVATAVPAHFPNGRLFDMGSFPMLLEGGAMRVQGQLMYPDKELSDEDYQLLVQRLDTLENYNSDDVDNSPYYRVLATVFLNDNQPVTAWVYLGRPIYTEGRPLIDSGDWVSYSAEGQSHIAGWWEERGLGLLFDTGNDETSGKE